MNQYFKLNELKNIKKKTKKRSTATFQSFVDNILCKQNI